MSEPDSTLPSPDDPAARAELIVQSLRAYAHAWLGLIPVVGMVFSVTALVWASQAARGERTLWNPARRYRRAGAWIASIACIVWLVADALLLLWILSRLV